MMLKSMNYLLLMRSTRNIQFPKRLTNLWINLVKILIELFIVLGMFEQPGKLKMKLITVILIQKMSMLPMIRFKNQKMFTHQIKHIQTMIYLMKRLKIFLVGIIFVRVYYTFRVLKRHLIACAYKVYQLKKIICVQRYLNGVYLYTLILSL